MASKDPDQGPFDKKMIEMMLFWFDGTLLLSYLIYSENQRKKHISEANIPHGKNWISKKNSKFTKRRTYAQFKSILDCAYVFRNAKKNFFKKIQFFPFNSDLFALPKKVDYNSLFLRFYPVFGLAIQIFVKTLVGLFCDELWVFRWVFGKFFSAKNHVFCTTRQNLLKKIVDEPSKLFTY